MQQLEHMHGFVRVDGREVKGGSGCEFSRMQNAGTETMTGAGAGLGYGSRLQCRSSSGAEGGGQARVRAQTRTPVRVHARVQAKSQVPCGGCCRERMEGRYIRAWGAVGMQLVVKHGEGAMVSRRGRWSEKDWGGSEGK